MVLVGGMDTSWKPGGGRMSEKSSLLSDDAVSSSSEDMSTTAGCKEVMCERRAYANSQHKGIACCTHLRRSLCRIWGGVFPRTSRVVSSAEKEVREGWSSSRVSRWNLTVNLSDWQVLLVLSGTDI